MITAVFFSTSTCKHCIPFKKIFEEVTEMYDEDELSVTYRIVDKEPDSMNLAMEWQIGSVPTVIFGKDGVFEDSQRLVGAIPQSDLINLIQSRLHV